MKSKSFVIITLGALLFTVGTGIIQAQQISPISGLLSADADAGLFYPDFSMYLGVRRYINSFTSYQFPDPQQPGLDPLSRLEWPWEQTFGTVELAVRKRYVRVKLDGAATWSVFRT